jgi:triosephosphate isomerase
MNKDINETIAYANEFNNLVKSVANNVCVGIAIPYINLAKACETFNLANITILAENISEHESGAYTSQISIPMIKSLGVKQTLIGHSEVRQYLNETDELLNKKIHACLNNNIVPVVCIGETLQQFENGTTEQVVIKQLDTCLANIKHEQCANIIIAYEPV